MSEAGVVVLVVSDKGAPAVWQQDDMSTIHDLLAGGNHANRIVLVVASGTARSVLPADVASATAYEAETAGLTAVAAEIAAEARSAGRPATVMVGRMMAMIDDIWNDMEAARGQPPTVPAGHGQRFETLGEDLLVTTHGDLRRITPDEYRQQLSSGQLDDVARIEKSMEINLSEWKRVYPTRAVNPADHVLFVRVKEALGEDLEGVIRLLGSAGFYLDDHYLGVREALRSNA